MKLPHTKPWRIETSLASSRSLHTVRTVLEVARVHSAWLFWVWLDGDLVAHGERRRFEVAQRACDRAAELALLNVEVADEDLSADRAEESRRAEGSR